MAPHLPPGALVGIGLAMLFVLLLLVQLFWRFCCMGNHSALYLGHSFYDYDSEGNYLESWRTSPARPPYAFAQAYRIGASANSALGYTTSAPSPPYAQTITIRRQELPVELSESQTVNPRDVWEPTDLERFASPVASMLERPVLLQEAQKCMASMGESSTHYNTEISVLRSSPEATTEEPTTESQKSIEIPSLAEILPAHIKDPKNEETLSIMSSEQQSTIPKIACKVAGCTRTFNKQYELNHHMRYHTRQNVCETCQASFGTVTHLNRHINSVHQTAKVYHCTVAGCSYFKTANPPKSFSRKDNWRRHMIEQHGGGQGDDFRRYGFLESCN